MKVNSEYIIPFVGLKDGKHQYQFELEQPFFDLFEYTEAIALTISVNLELEKQSTMLILNFSLTGTITGECGRCMGEVTDIAEGDYRLIARFTDEDYEETEEIINLPSSEHEIDISSYLYEFSLLSFPSNFSHEEDECSQEMLEHLDQYLVENAPEQENEQTETDPRWDALNKLKNN